MIMIAEQLMQMIKELEERVTELEYDRNFLMSEVDYLREELDNHVL